LFSKDRHSCQRSRFSDVPRRRKILLALLIPTLVVAAWQWLAPKPPYEKDADPRAGAEIRYVQLTSDHSYHWMHVRLKVTAEDTSDLLPGLVLITSSGRRLTPTGLELEGRGKGTATFEGPHLDKIEGLTVQFWLEKNDFDGPLQLQVGDGTLTVRTGSGSPEVPAGQEEVHHRCDW
jgi:hypothetical protein